MKVALVTGASRGIGKSIADALVDQGYYVYYGVRNGSNDEPSETSQEIVLDVTSDSSIQQAANQIRDNSGNLDLLVNNAGLSKTSATDNQPEKVTKLDMLDRSALQRIFDVNTISPMIVAKYMVPIMKKEGSYIVNISSIRATYENSANGAGNYGYSSSKIALNMLTALLAHELPSNISTFAVHPGSVRTDMNPTGVLSPTESANHILAILKHWQPVYNGTFLNYDGSKL